MANFDTNTWYQLTFGDGTSEAMVGTGLYDHGKGAVFFGNTNTSDPQQQWQLFPYNSTYYVLRSKESGQYGYMCVEVGNTTAGLTPGNTVPAMRNVTLADNSMFWTISPWGDGTFYMTNAANSTNWHLQVRPNSLMSMSSNITAPQKGQSFSFNQEGAINQPGYSSVSLPSSTSTSTSTASPTASTPASISSSSSSSGLSTGAKAGIGIGIAAVALLALFALGFFFLRRRKRRTQPSYTTEMDSGHERKSMMPSDAQGLAPFSDVYGSENTRKPALAPQELDPATAAMYEMEAGKERARKGRSMSPYRPGVDNEQKAVMPQGFFRDNAAVEMDAGQHPIEMSELPGEGERGP